MIDYNLLRETLKKHEQEKQKLIEEFLPIIEAGINTAIRMLSHSEKSRKHELHNEIEDLIDENMNALKLYLENYKKKWEERLKKYLEDADDGT